MLKKYLKRTLNMLPLILSSTQLNHTTVSHILHSRIIKTKKNATTARVALKKPHLKPKRKFSHPNMVNQIFFQIRHLKNKKQRRVKFKQENYESERKM